MVGRQRNREVINVGQMLDDLTSSVHKSMR
jgi:hypothetical protein